MNEKETRKLSDLATWNLIKNYRAVLNAGIEAVILKVINKSNNPDGRFYEHVSGCSGVGLPIIGGYTYSYANTVDKAKKAANKFIEVGAPKGIKTMWLDLEDKSMMGLGHKIVDIINVYRKAAQDAGMGFGIYTGAQFYNPYLKPYACEIADIPIWWARYPFIKEYVPATPAPDSKYLPADMDIAGWQYTSKGVIPGVSGYVDLNIWYKEEPQQNTTCEITVEYNPFAEPVGNVKIGSAGNDAMWVQWYLWKFGLLLTDGTPDKTKITGCIDEACQAAIKESQRRLGLAGQNIDGIVGQITRALYKKIC